MIWPCVLRPDGYLPLSGPVTKREWPGEGSSLIRSERIFVGSTVSKLFWNPALQNATSFTGL